MNKSNMFTLTSTVLPRITQHVIRKALFEHLLVILPIVLFSITTYSLNGQNKKPPLIDYHINVKTASNESLTGTDENVQFKIQGSKGTTPYILMNGTKESGEEEETKVKNFIDVGKITGLVIDRASDLNFGLGDDWKIEWISITKESQVENRKAKGGYYLFKIDDWASDYKTVKPTESYHRKPEPEAKGDMKPNLEVNRRVYLAENFGGETGQTVSKSVELWSTSKSVSISSTNQTTLGAAVAVTYESPESVYGQFSVEARGSWEQMINDKRDDIIKNGYSKTFDWSFKAPSDRATLSLVVYTVPFSREIYCDGENCREVRGINAEITEKSEEFLYFPTKIDGKVVPISWSKVENEWVKYADDFTKSKIRKHKSKWLANGWIFVEGTPPNPNRIDSELYKDVVKSEKANPYTYNKTWRVEKHVRELADVNGDGRNDIVGFGNSGVFVSLANSNGSFGNVIEASRDFGADGNKWQINRHVRKLADVNGDGRADIVAFGNTKVMVALGKNDGTFEVAKEGHSDFCIDSGGWRVDQHVRELGDVNGDGRADIVAFGLYGVLVALGQRNGTFGPTIAASTNYGSAEGKWKVEKHVRKVGDVDGDGKADIIAFGDKSVSVSLGKRDGTFGKSKTAFNDFCYENGGWRIDQNVREVVDVTGDGKADIVGFGYNGVLIAAGKSDGTFSAIVTPSATTVFGASSGKWKVNKHVRKVADVTGDGKADIVGFGEANLYVAIAK